MISKWESRNQRSLRFLRIAPRKKLEWLQEMHEFLRRVLTKRQRHIYYKLRETR